MDIHHTQFYLVRSSLRFARHCTSLLSQSFFLSEYTRNRQLTPSFFCCPPTSSCSDIVPKICHNTFSLLPIWLFYCILIVHKGAKVINFSLESDAGAPFSIFSPVYTPVSTGIVRCLFPARDPLQTGIFCKMDGIAHICFSLFLPKAATASGFPKRRFSF